MSSRSIRIPITTGCRSLSVPRSASSHIPARFPPAGRGCIRRTARRRPGVPPPITEEHQPSTMTDWEKQIRRWVGEPEEIAPAPVPPPQYAPPPIVQKIPPEIKHRSQKVGPDIQLTTMPASTAAYREGSELTTATARRIHGIDNLTSAHAPAPGRTHAERRSAEGAAAVSYVKHHQTIRQALLASVILGPPKSLEG